jgi:hypothetical protein
VEVETKKLLSCRPNQTQSIHAPHASSRTILSLKSRPLHLASQPSATLLRNSYNSFFLFFFNQSNFIGSPLCLEILSNFNCYLSFFRQRLEFINKNNSRNKNINSFSKKSQFCD